MSKKNVSKTKETPSGVSHRMPKSGESMIGTLHEREALAEREKLASCKPMKERIRPIKDYESLYAASTSGKIYRIKSNGDYVALKSSTAPNGYQTVGLSKDNKCHSYLVHDIIARTFYGERPKETPFIRHLDGDKTNNALENLKYGTWWENTFDMYLMGDSRTRSGLGALDVIAMREMAENGIPVREISETLGCCETAVRNVISGRVYGWVPNDKESIARIIAEVARVKGEGKDGDCSLPQ